MTSDTAALLQGIGLILTSCSIGVAVVSYFATVVREARQAARCVFFFERSGQLIIQNVADSPVTDLTLAVDEKPIGLDNTFLEPRTGVMAVDLPHPSEDCVITFQGPKGMRWECIKDMAPTMVDAKFVKPWKNVLRNFFGM